MVDSFLWFVSVDLIYQILDGGVYCVQDFLEMNVTSLYKYITAILLGLPVD